MSRRLKSVSAGLAIAVMAAVPAQAGKGHDGKDHHTGKGHYGKNAKQPAYGLTKNGRALVAFDARNPGNARYVGYIDGLAKRERLVGIDFRPRTGELVGVGSQSNVYALDLSDADATKQSTLTVNGMPLSLTGDSFGVDFNPTVDRLRVVSDQEQNLRINVDTGVTTVDKALNYGAMDDNAGTDPSVVGSAYTNNDNDEIVVAPAMPTPGTTGTMLFGIDSGLDSLALQAPPNDGVLSTIGELGARSNKVVGFDVFSKVDGGKAVANTAYASLRRNGRTRLYTIDLATGDADRVGGSSRAFAHVGDIAIRPQG